MPNASILKSVSDLWRNEAHPNRRVLDLSCGGGDTARMLSAHGYQTIATEFRAPPFLGDSIQRIGGVDLNKNLPFKNDSFDGVDLIEVIEHVEHQAQLIREMARIVKPNGVIIVSTPNVMNVFSRIRFLFTGFLRGRSRPLHYTFTPAMAHNIYLISFYELYYLLFHSGCEVEELGRTRIKFASRFFLPFVYPFMWLFSLFAVIQPEKDPVQRKLNWQILGFLFDPALLLSDNIVVKARKTGRTLP
ncbi:MAG TPA: class I SAM-dependent methyltransferase [Candidatus Binatia bacterium]|jgi:SAM-dependent methyltransferase